MRDRVGRPILWWSIWILACVPAGALAGVGFVEFNWGGPPYDGGFAGDLLLFGGFLALGQAPFVAGLVWIISRSKTAARGAALLWVAAGFIGWMVGSYIDVFLIDVFLMEPLFSPRYSLARTVRWLVLAAAQGVVLGIVLTDASRARRYGGRPVVVFAAWIVASVVGGLLFEGWVVLDVVAAGKDGLVDDIGGYLRYRGFAENVALLVVPYALSVPVLYGLPTGAVFAGIVGGLTERSPRQGAGREFYS